jgi:integrase
MGSVYRRGKTYWIKYYRNGKPMRESARSDKEGEAKTLLKKREGAIANGEPVSPRIGRVTFREATDDVVNDYRVNGKRSLSDTQRRIDKHLAPYFGNRRLADITTPHIRAFIVTRQEAGATAGEINRELGAVKRAFNLAIQAGKALHKPYVPMLKENNVRTGFFEADQFAAVVAQLPKPLQAVVKFAYITGWRIPSEVLTLQWRQVNFDTGEIRLNAGTTKNGEGRVFPMTNSLRELLTEQKAEADQLKQAGTIVPYVFHRNGRRIRTIRWAWKEACKGAGCPGRIPHDLRRTAVRNLVRTGIPERVAMTMTGHKTRSVFERYNIVSDGDLLEAAQKLDQASARDADRALRLADDQQKVAGTDPGTNAAVADGRVPS